MLEKAGLVGNLRCEAGYACSTWAEAMQVINRPPMMWFPAQDYRFTPVLY